MTRFFSVFDGNVWEFAVDGISKRKLTDGLDRHIVGVVARQGTHSVWQPNDAQSICIQTHDPETKQEGLYLINTVEAHAVCLFEGPIFITRRSPDEFDLPSVGSDTQIVYRAQDSASPEEIWTFDIGTGKRHQVTDLNPHFA